MKTYVTALNSCNTRVNQILAIVKQTPTRHKLIFKNEIFTKPADRSSSYFLSLQRESALTKQTKRCVKMPKNIDLAASGLVPL